jgi:hypothetical protein
MARVEKRLKAQEFVFYTEDLALAGLPEGFAKGDRKLMWSILQYHLGCPEVHFELQPQPSRSIVELGLHFEADVETNERWAEVVARHTVPILAALGDEWELEEWTASWRRLHRVFPAEHLTASLGREVAEQFTRLFLTLQPIISGAYERGEAPRPGRPAAAPSQRRHRNRQQVRR